MAELSAAALEQKFHACDIIKNLIKKMHHY